jgi:hypothetical protein
MVYTGFTFSQNFRPLQNYPSPNAANLGVYGQIPISYFTGQPNISIPIYEIKEGIISLPISLDYHLSSVKPNVHHSWVGLGWNLSAGGCITRNVRGRYDEKRSSVDSAGFYDYHYKLDVDNWNDIDYLRGEAMHLSARPEDAWELMADEFNFNFCGYSGSFYLNEKGGWTVISDDAIKVEFNASTGFISFDNLIAERQNCGDDIRIDRSHYDAVSSNTRFFNEFTLITPDGIRYTFGGKFATEYSISYFSRNNADFISTSWFLSKITSPDGRILTLEYEPGHPVCEVKPSFYQSFVDNPPIVSSPLSLNNSNGTTTVQQAMRGHLIFPVYLKKIESSLCSINLKSTPTSIGRPRRYFLLWEYDGPDYDYRYNAFEYDENAVAPYRFFDQYFIKKYDQLMWRELDEIKIQSSGINRLFSFSYAPNSNRFKLERLTEGITDNGNSYAEDYDGNGILFPADTRSYQFEYNNTELLPEYGTRKEDHWGYYNNNNDPVTINFQATVPGSSENAYFQLRKMDNTVGYKHLKAETLKSIKYPTGGYTEFEYEPHDHSKVVSATYNSLENYNEKAGGLRVAKTTSYSADGKFASAKKYYYTKDITKLAALPLESSGILAYKPSYTQVYPFIKYINNVPYGFSLVISTAGGVRPQSINLQEPHVTYSSVIEEEISSTGVSNGYIKYSYTNYDADINGNNHYDVMALTNYSSFNNSYSDHVSNNSKERGKLILCEYFNSNKKAIKSTKYKFQRIANETLRTVYYEAVTAVFSPYLGGDIGDFLISAYETNTYSYLPIEEIETLYEPSSGEVISENSKQYSYNSNKLLKDKTVIVKKGDYVERHTTETRYSSDITQGTYSQMTNKNMLNYPVETINKMNDSITGASLVTYKNLFPENIYKLNISLPLTSASFPFYNGVEKDYRYDSKPEIAILRYDSYYNIRETEDKNGLRTTYLWGYKGNYPVAEIKNVSYEKVSGALINADLNSLYPNMGSVDNLRSLFPESLISTYTYNPIVGMATSTDNRGIVTYYNYDHMGRLREVYIVEDNQKKILQSYFYNYKK